MHLFAPADGHPVEKAAIEEQPPDHPRPHRRHDLLQQRVEHGALAGGARQHAERDPGEVAPLPVRVEEGHQLVAAAPLAAGRLLGGQLGESLRLQGVAVGIEEQADRALVGGVVRDEEVGGVADEEALRVERLVRLQHAGHVAVSPTSGGPRPRCRGRACAGSPGRRGSAGRTRSSR